MPQQRRQSLESLAAKQAGIGLFTSLKAKRWNPDNLQQDPKKANWADTNGR
jgi:hypothetical protein